MVEVRQYFRRKRGQNHRRSVVVQMFNRLSERNFLGQAAWQRIHSFRLGRRATNNRMHGHAFRAGCMALAGRREGSLPRRVSVAPKAASHVKLSQGKLGWRFDKTSAHMRAGAHKRIGAAGRRMVKATANRECGAPFSRRGSAFSLVSSAGPLTCVRTSSG